MVKCNMPGIAALELPWFYGHLTGYYENCEYETKKWCIENIKEDWVCIDAGANIGYYTILYAQRASKGWVHAFEPTETFKMLVKNVEYNKVKNVNLMQTALGEYTGKFRETLQKCWGLEVESARYDFMSIDYYCKKYKVDRIDLIKIDTDGFDFEILKGAKQTIKKYNPYIIVEIYEPALEIRKHTSDEVLAWLGNMGFGTYRVLEDNNVLLKLGSE